MQLLRPVIFVALTFIAAPLVSLQTGCAAPARGPAVPDALADSAQIDGMKNVRSWEDRLDPAFFAELERAARKELDILKAEGRSNPLPPAYFLAISGGGQNGAYGAGLLNGWTAAGTRPTFKMVTGISTGALTAPFAFLGPSHDATLREVYTRTSTKDILETRGLIAGLFGDALTDNTPLRRMLAKYVDALLLSEVAAEYAKGRILLVGTTNLDAQRGVIWNMGAIASSGHPQALQLFQNILVASAAIPAAFPPVMINVVVDGKRYQEMHVDGGTVSQVFLYPPSMSIESTGISRQRNAYVIRNARLDPQWAQVERRTLSIASRAIDSLIQTQGFGDLYRIFLTTQRDNVDFNLAYIPDSFVEKPTQGFDPVYMTKLFDVAYNQARQGSAWIKTPPDYAPASSHVR